MNAKRLPQGLERLKRQKVARSPHADPPGQADRAGLLLDQKVILERFVDALGLSAESPISLGFSRACEGADSLRRAVHIAKQIQLPGAIPGVAGQDIQRPQSQMAIDG